MADTELTMHIVHGEYEKSRLEVLKIREATEGELAIKTSEQSIVYLPNPNDLDKTSPASLDKYASFKARAEYDNIASSTLTNLGGAMWSTPPTVELPTEIEYMIDNSDGSNLSLLESMEITASNIYQVKFHGLLADFDGVTNQAGIKHYPRESIVDWDFGVVNGINQLNYLKLVQVNSHVDKRTFKRVTKQDILILGLDESGSYYQQLIEQSDDGLEIVGELEYPELGGATLKSIPFRIVSDSLSKAHSMPKGFGILYPIVLKSIARYQVNADLKKVLHMAGSPTSWSKGWDDESLSLYRDMTGKEHIEVGVDSHIPLPKDSDIGYLEWNPESGGLFKYLEENQKEIKAFGGNFDTSDGSNEMVGVAKIRNAEQLRAVVNVANSIESAYIDLIEIVFGFMSTKKAMPDYEFSLNKEFEQVKLNPQERTAILNEFTQGLIPRVEALRQMYNGGVSTVDAETMMAEAELTSSI